MAASDHIRRELDANLKAARETGMDYRDWCIKQRLDARGLPWTRDNYIEQLWHGELPEEWDEGEISPDLQDWDKGGP